MPSRHVEDLDAEVRGPPLVERGRQRLPRRGGQPDPGQGIRRETSADHVREEGGAGEEQGGPVPAGPLGQQLGLGRGRLEHGGGPHRQREEHGVAQAVGEERLGRRQAPVLGADAQHLAGVGLADHPHRAVPVHRGLGRPGRARGVEPERGRVGRGGVDRVIGLAGGQLLQRVHRQLHGHLRRGARQHPGQLRRRRDGLRRDPGELPGEREQPRPRVAQQLGQVLGVHHGGDRDRDRAHPQGGEEHGEELRRVRHEHHHPLLGLQP